MSEFLDFNGLSLYDRNVKKRTADNYYNKDQIDNIVAGIETDILWKDAVQTYSDIATTYPYPREGWTVNVLDTGNTYRYDGSNWVQISASVIPKATSANDGLMPKEMYTKVDSLGTAALKDASVTVDWSENLPTAAAVNEYITNALTQLSEGLEAELSLKIGIDDVGDASERDYTDDIPGATGKVLIKGEWYSYDENTLFYLEGTGVNDGIDMSFAEELNNYTIRFNLYNYSTPLSARLHMVGTKTDPITSEVTNIDTYCDEGDVLSIDIIPDEYLDGSDSATLEVTIPDYEIYNIAKLNSLIWPVFYDGVNDVDIPMIDNTKYDSEVVIHQEYDVLLNDHIVTAKYGKYSTLDLPTSSAVSTLISAVADALQTMLEAQIDEVEAKIDDFEEVTDEDIESLFSENNEVTDEDIENLFG